MIFSRYGLDFQRLESGHLEMVRGWRNADWVRAHMQYRHIITPEAQLAWFSALHPRRSWYFVVHREANPFALVQVKDIDWRQKKGEAGAFAGSPGYLGHPQAALAILGLMDFAFFILGLQGLEAKYHPDFKEIAMLNRQLGYEPFAGEADGFIRASVSAGRYLQHAGKLRRAGETVYGRQTRLAGGDQWLERKAAKSRDLPGQW